MTSGGHLLSRTDFLRALFRSFDEYDVRYCVLHSYEGLPERLPSDLDLAIHPGDVPKLPGIFRTLAQEGYQPIQHLNYAVGAGYFVFAWFEGLVLKSVAVDVICEHRRGGLILASGEVLVSGRRRHGDFWIPDPVIEFSYLLAKKALKKSMRPCQEHRLKALIEELGARRAEQIAGELFGERSAKQIVENCARESFQSLLPGLGRELWWRRVSRNPIGAIRSGLGDFGRVARRWRQPTGLFLAVLGPDGAGKSTLIEGLLPQMQGAFRRCARFHWRPQLLWRRKTAGPVTHPHGRPPHGPWRSVARLWAHMLDFWAGYWLVVRPLLARSGLVVFDRYYEDLLADPGRYRYGGPLWLGRALCRFIPRPDLVLVLDAGREIIQSRKQEVSLEELERQRQAYLRLPTETRPGCIINAAQPRPEIVAEAARIVVAYMACRYERRHAQRLPFGERQAASPTVRTREGATGNDEGIRRALFCVFGDACRSAILTKNGTVRRGRHLAASSRPAEPQYKRQLCYAMLPSGDAPRLLLPLGPSNVTLQGTQIFTPYAFRARIAKGLLAASLRLGWSNWLSDRLLVTVPDRLPLESLVSEVTGVSKPVFAFWLGTANKYWKLTVQVMQADGEILGYVKLPLSQEATDRVRYEATVLQRLGSLATLRPYIPRVLYASEWMGKYLLFQSAVEGQPGLTKLSEVHEQFLQMLRPLCPTQKGAHDLVEEVACRWRNSESLLDTEWRVFGERALNRAGRELAGAMIPCGIAHGDFAPWNTRMRDGHLFVFDWESAAWGTPILWDKFHFEVQVASLLGRGARSPRHFAAANGRSPAETAQQLLYLLDSAARLAGEGGQRGVRALQYRKRMVGGLLKARLAPSNISTCWSYADM